MTKPKVLFVGDLNKDLPEYIEFRKKFECIDYTIESDTQLILDFQTKFHDIAAIYGGWLGFAGIGGFKNEVLKNAPTSLQLVAVCSVGYDGYDGSGMASRNMHLTNVPSQGAAEPVADLVMYNTLASFRNFCMFQQVVSPKINHTVQIRSISQSGTFDSETGHAQPGPVTGYAFGEIIAGRSCLNPRGHNVLIVGFGNIGQTIAGKLYHGLGMNIHYTKRNKLSDKEEKSLKYPVTYHKNIIDARDIVDLIVIAAPGTPQTVHLVNEEVIDLISKPFRIINIGRGSIIDEGALVKGLKSGKVLFAGLDVYEEEPRIHPELFGRHDVILTPHIGASTMENYDYTAIMAMKNIENVILGGGVGLSKVN